MRNTTVAVGLGVAASDTVIIASGFDKVDKVVISSTDGSTRRNNVELTTFITGVEISLGGVNLTGNLNVIAGGNEVSRQNEA